MQWRKWRNWRKIASCWRFELDAKSGPLEVDDFGENGDFGEIGDFGKNRHACIGESGKTGKKSPAAGLGKTENKSYKWPERDSNLGPRNCESDALTTRPRRGLNEED